jgi:hypothetical protein
MEKDAELHAMATLSPRKNLRMEDWMGPRSSLGAMVKWELEALPGIEPRLTWKQEYHPQSLFPPLHSRIVRLYACIVHIAKQQNFKYVFPSRIPPLALKKCREISDSRSGSCDPQQLKAVNSVNKTGCYLASSIRELISVSRVEENRIFSILFLNFNKDN